MAKQSSAGTLIAISAAAPATNDVTGYGALTWTTVGEVTSFGEHGVESALITHEPLATSSTEKFKGQFNPGAVAIPGAADRENAGQVLLEAAAADTDKYSVRITYQDGAKCYFSGLVMTFKYNPGGANALVSFSSNIEIDGKTRTTTFVWDEAA
jgi:hypothetical protein